MEASRKTTMANLPISATLLTRWVQVSDNIYLLNQTVIVKKRPRGGMIFVILIISDSVNNVGPDLDDS